MFVYVVNNQDTANAYILQLPYVFNKLTVNSPCLVPSGIYL